MFIARWHLTAGFSKVEDCLSILKKWEIDVGERIGWRLNNVRILTGVLGAPQSDIEYEVTFDSLSDLESAWNDLEKSPHHREYMKQLDTVLAPGGNRWSVHRRIDVRPAD
jgi:hypothetical protein